MARFFLLIRKIKFKSQRATAGWNIVSKTPTFEVGTKMHVMVRACPPGKLCTIQDVLSGLPPKHDPKIEEMDCVYSPEDSAEESGGRIHRLHFGKVTLHKSFSTEEEYLSDISSMLQKIRSIVEEQADIQITGWKPSMLVLKSVNDNITFSNPEFLFRLEYDLGQASKILKELAATVYEVPTRTGVLEYKPITRT